MSQLCDTAVAHLPDPTIPQGGYHDFTHFIYEDVEVQRGQVTLHSGDVLKLEFTARWGDL